MIGEEQHPRFNPGPKPPVEMDEYGHRVIGMTPLRRRRLIEMAGQGFNHKAFYGQYCFLIGEGLCGWTIGFAYRTPEGEEELKRLKAKGI